MHAGIYVMPFKGVWAVKKEAEEEPLSIHETKDEAVESAKKLINGDTPLVILRADGTIDNPEAYSSDSLLPEDDETEN